MQLAPALLTVCSVCRGSRPARPQAAVRTATPPAQVARSPQVLRLVRTRGWGTDRHGLSTTTMRMNERDCTNPTGGPHKHRQVG